MFSLFFVCSSSFLPRLLLATALVVFHVAALEASAQAPETVVRERTLAREGYLAHEWPNGEQALYLFRVYDDGTTSVREGMDEAAPTITVPRPVIRLLGEQVELMAPGDPQRVDRFSVAVDRRTLWVRWAKRMDLPLVLGGGVFLVGGLIGLIAWGWVRRERAERLRIAESRAHLAAGQESERARLAHEIHDGSLQDLHGIHRRVGMLRARIAAPPAEVITEAEIITEEVEEDLLGVIAELRAVMADLQPPALGPFGLGAAIRAHAERFRLRYPTLDLDLALPADEPDLPGAVRLVFFRVCQEAMSNAAKHARADQVGVRFRIEGRAAVLEVTDDGEGFAALADLRRFAEKGNYGLSNMRARAEAIGASLSVDSALGAGTRVRVAVPIMRAEQGKGRVMQRAATIAPFDVPVPAVRPAPAT